MSMSGMSRASKKRNKKSGLGLSYKLGTLSKNKSSKGSIASGGSMYSGGSMHSGGSSMYSGGNTVVR